MLKVTTTQTGGQRVKKLFDTALKGGVSEIEVGFFSTAKYPDGKPVAAVAAWNEFGTKRGGKVHAPERPFFRQAIRGMRKGVEALVRRGVDPQRMVVDTNLANTVGAYAQGQVQESIVDLVTPPNAPATIEAKRRKLHGRKARTSVGVGGNAVSVGESNPLIDTGFMRLSVTWKVRE